LAAVSKINSSIENVAPNSIAQKLGIEKRDILLSINGEPIRDVIDYMFYSKEDNLLLEVQKDKKLYSFKVRRKDNEDLGIDLKPFRIKTCRNNCIFCFVNQLPRNMRKPLYLKDDDYRMSFLYGNYITLTNISDADKKRIFEQRLSPLYVSVHTTNNELRRSILKNPKAPDILKEIKKFVSNKIRLHTQIVVCPGINDSKDLINTVKDLCKFYPYVASIAVVPVGLSKHRQNNIEPVEKSDATKIFESLEPLRKRLKKRHGEFVVYPSDELYIKAGLPFPAFKEYGDLPQLENGVGMVPIFMNSMKKLRLPKKIEQKRYVTFTGTSFAPYLDETIQRFRAIEGLSIDVFKIENRVFGPTVTVTGLLTGRDVLKTLMHKVSGDCLLIPDVALKAKTDIFIDNVTLKDIAETLNITVKAIESTPEGLLKGVTNGYNRED